jgi:gamma-glutamylcyclotransferase (GGCT)/AIG2-like uncharacterized protein YtfP
VKPSADHTLLFIYGTLKRGGANHEQLTGQQYLGEARTPPGYRLHDLGEYPGLVIDATDTRGVGGELWAVSASCLHLLDAFEGVPEGLYRRDAVDLVAPHTHLTVETYFYLRSLAGRPIIPDGNWAT